MQTYSVLGIKMHAERTDYDMISRGVHERCPMLRYEIPCDTTAYDNILFVGFIAFDRVFVCLI